MGIQRSASASRKKKKTSCERFCQSRETLLASLFMSIVRVFPFARGFVTFPRLLFWRLPSARRSSLPHFSPLVFSVHTPPPAPPSFCSRFSHTGCVPAARGHGRRDLAIVELFFPKRGAVVGGVFGRWRPLLRGKC